MYSQPCLSNAEIHALQVRMWSDSLIQTLLPSNRTIREELELWQYREFRLSPKDHWEVNGILDHLEEWNSLPQASILAVFGPTHERDSWVTEFILDTVQAFQVQGELVTFAMCDRPDNEHYTPLTLVKTIICQILEQRPSLILEEPDLFSARSFQTARQFRQACTLLEHIVAKIDSLVVLIDRIDQCRSDLGENDEELAEVLMRLVSSFGKKLKVIVTSTDLPPEELPTDVPISICQVSSFKMPSASQSRRRVKRTMLYYDYGMAHPWISATYDGQKNPRTMFQRYWDEIWERRPPFAPFGHFYMYRAALMGWPYEMLHVFPNGEFSGLLLRKP